MDRFPGIDKLVHAFGGYVGGSFLRAAGVGKKTAFVLMSVIGIAYEVKNPPGDAWDAVAVSAGAALVVFRDPLDPPPVPPCNMRTTDSLVTAQIERLCKALRQPGSDTTITRHENSTVSYGALARASGVTRTR